MACEGFATRLPFADKTGAKTGFDGQGGSCWEDQVVCGWQSSLPDLHQGPSQQGTQLGPYRDPGEPPALARNPIPAPTGRLQPGKMAALPVAGCLHGRVICLRTQATVDRGWRFAESAQAPGLSRDAAACLRSWGRRWARFPFMSMTIDCTVCGRHPRLPAWQTHTSVSATPLTASRLSEADKSYPGCSILWCWQR